MLISFLFSLWGYYVGPIWDPSGQTAYGTHAEPGYTYHMGRPYGTHIIHVCLAFLYYLLLSANFSSIICNRSQLSFTTMYFPCPKVVCSFR